MVTLKIKKDILILEDIKLDFEKWLHLRKSWRYDKDIQIKRVVFSEIGKIKSCLFYLKNFQVVYVGGDHFKSMGAGGLQKRMGFIVCMMSLKIFQINETESIYHCQWFNVYS